MRANRVSAYVFAVAASLAGCAGGGSGEVRYSGQVAVSSPELVEIEPGVQVIADADEPMFYADDSYWLYRDGTWMRSNDYRGGFVQVQLSYVPESIRVIDRPQTYVHYRRNHQREYEARRQEMQRRSQSAPQRTDVYRAGPSQGPIQAPTQRDDAWERDNDRTRDDRDRDRMNGGDFDRTRVNGELDHNRPVMTPGATPLPQDANPTPPVTSPNDVHGTPMPPHQAPPIPQPQQQRQQPDRNNGSTIDGEHGNDHRPMAPGEDHGRSATPNSDRDSDRRAAPSPGQARRPGPQPVAPATEPSRNDDRDRDRDRGNGDRDRDNDRGNSDRDKDHGQMNHGNAHNDMGRGDEMNDSNRPHGNSANTPAQQKREDRDNRDRDKADKGNGNGKKHDR